MCVRVCVCLSPVCVCVCVLVSCVCVCVCLCLSRIVGIFHRYKFSWTGQISAFQNFIFVVVMGLYKACSHTTYFTCVCVCVFYMNGSQLQKKSADYAVILPVLF